MVHSGESVRSSVKLPRTLGLGLALGLGLGLGLEVRVRVRVRVCLSLKQDLSSNSIASSLVLSSY